MQTKDSVENRLVRPSTLWKLAIVAACGVCFGLLAFDISGTYYMAGFDTAIYNIIHRLSCPFFTGFFQIMTNMVNPAVLLVISISMVHFLKQRKYLVALFCNLGITVLLNLAVKGAVMRVRPPEELRVVYESGYSFPSGHTMVAASFYGFLAFLLWKTDKTRTRKMQGTVLCFLMILLVGVSRIYLGVHYGTDVLGGFLLSAIYLMLYTGIVGRYFEQGERSMATSQLLQNQRLVMSFKHAIDGMIAGLKTERNMMIHYSALCLVIVFGVTLKLDTKEWCICLLLCTLVIAMELMNTALEAVVDLVTVEQKPLAKLAKDTAAGAVLVSAIGAAVIGTIIFLPKMIGLFT